MREAAQPFREPISLYVIPAYPSQKSRGSEAGRRRARENARRNAPLLGEDGRCGRQALPRLTRILPAGKGFSAEASRLWDLERVHRLPGLRFVSVKSTASTACGRHSIAVIAPSAQVAQDGFQGLFYA